MDETTLEVQGMACDGCEQNVTTALEALEGVTAVTADHEDAKVRVTHEEAVIDTDGLGSAIEDAGYEVVG